MPVPSKSGRHTARTISNDLINVPLPEIFIPTNSSKLGQPVRATVLSTGARLTAPFSPAVSVGLALLEPVLDPRGGLPVTEQPAARRLQPRITICPCFLQCEFQSRCFD